MYYILDDDYNPIPASMQELGEFMSDMDNQRVAATNIGGYYVSTVFLGVDHGLIGQIAPLLFETMIFINDDSAKDDNDCSYEDRYCERYYTYTEALEGHHKIVKQLDEWWDPNEDEETDPNEGNTG